MSEGEKIKNKLLQKAVTANGETLTQLGLQRTVIGTRNVNAYHRVSTATAVTLHTR